MECVVGWLRRGKSDIEARVLLKEELCIRGRLAQRAIDRAHERLNESFSLRSDQDRFALAIEQRDTVISKAMENDDYRIALSAMDSRDKLLQLGDRAESSALPQSLLDLIELAAREQERGQGIRNRE